MNKIYDYIKQNYNVNEPIFIDDIKNIYQSYSSKYIYKLIKPYIIENKLLRFDKAVYYIPTYTSFGLSKLNVQKIIEKKYIKNNEEIFGSYTGLKLLNDVGLTNQVPNVFEIVTNKETNIKRQVVLGNARVILRVPKTKIDSDNIEYIQFLEIFNNLKDKEIVEKKEKILELKKVLNLDNNKLFEIAKNYSNKILVKLIRSGEMYGIFT